MYERCLSEAERVLAARKEVVVPVKVVWHEVVKNSRQQRFEVPSIADFTAMLEADARFEFLPAHQSVIETVDLPRDDQDVEENELESLGFFGEDRVKLSKMKFPGGFDSEEEEVEEEGEVLATPNRSTRLTKRASKPLLAAPRRKGKSRAGNNPHNGSSFANRRKSRKKHARKPR